MKILVFLLCVAGVAALLPTQQAHAWLRVCNNQSRPFLFTYYKDDPGQCGTALPQRVRGWWNIAGNTCVTVDSGSFQNRMFGYVGHTNDGGPIRWIFPSGTWWTKHPNFAHDYCWKDKQDASGKFCQDHFPGAEWCSGWNSGRRSSSSRDFTINIDP